MGRACASSSLSAAFSQGVMPQHGSFVLGASCMPLPVCWDAGVFWFTPWFRNTPHRVAENAVLYAAHGIMPQHGSFCHADICISEGIPQHGSFSRGVTRFVLPFSHPVMVFQGRYSPGPTSSYTLAAHAQTQCATRTAVGTRHAAVFYRRVSESHH